VDRSDVELDRQSLRNSPPSTMRGLARSDRWQPTQRSTARPSARRMIRIASGLSRTTESTWSSSRRYEATRHHDTT
jgi:hypothetical protein